MHPTSSRIACEAHTRAGKAPRRRAPSSMLDGDVHNDRTPADVLSGRGSYRYPWGLSRAFSGEAGDPGPDNYKLAGDAPQSTQPGDDGVTDGVTPPREPPTPALPTSTVTVPALEAALSAERLTTFRQLGDDDATVLARYAWNQAVVDAFGFPLHLLEVALRNAVDGVGRRATGPVTRHGGVPSWLDTQPAVLDGAHARTTADAREALRARGAPLSPGRLVAELTFGFWVQLFNGYYDQGAARRHRPGFPLWTSAALRAAFPSAPAHARNRETLRARLDGIRTFRNRLSHHEPIFHRDPARWHREVAATVRWLSVPTAEYLAAFDITASVIAGGYAPYVPRCRALLGLPPATATQQ